MGKPTLAATSSRCGVEVGNVPNQWCGRRVHTNGQSMHRQGITASAHAIWETPAYFPRQSSVPRFSQSANAASVRADARARLCQALGQRRSGALAWYGKAAWAWARSGAHRDGISVKRERQGSGPGGPLVTLWGSLADGPFLYRKTIPPTILGTFARPPIVTRRSRCGSRRLGAHRDRRRVRP
jgi:hypothetical protein